MKAKKLLLTILSVFALLFLLTACKGKGKGTWDAKKTTYDSPDVKLTFTKIDPMGPPGERSWIRYYFEITNKTEDEKTVGDLLNDAVDTVKQGNKTLPASSPFSKEGEWELNRKVKPNQTVASQIDYRFKDQNRPVDMVFENGKHYKLTKRDLSDIDEQQIAENSKAEDHEVEVSEKTLTHIETAPGKFNWTLKQYEDLKDDLDLDGDKLEDILKAHPTPLDKGMDDVALVLTYGNGKNKGPTVVLTFRLDSNDELRLVWKEQTGLK